MWAVPYPGPLGSTQLQKGISRGTQQTASATEQQAARLEPWPVKQHQCLVSGVNMPRSNPCRDRQERLASKTSNQLGNGLQHEQECMHVSSSAGKRSMAFVGFEPSQQLQTPWDLRQWRPHGNLMFANLDTTTTSGATQHRRSIDNTHAVNVL